MEEEEPPVQVGAQVLTTGGVRLLLTALKDGGQEAIDGHPVGVDGLVEAAIGEVVATDTGVEVIDTAVGIGTRAVIGMATLTTTTTVRQAEALLDGTDHLLNKALGALAETPNLLQDLEVGHQTGHRTALLGAAEEAGIADPAMAAAEAAGLVADKDLGTRIAEGHLREVDTVGECDV